jgi:hypothetical protein
MQLCFRLGKRAAETHETLVIEYESNAVTNKTVFMLILIFDVEEMVHSEFVPRGQTVNLALYEEVLQRLREAVRRKKLEKWTNGWMFHHDNALCHTSLYIRHFVTGKNIPVHRNQLAVPTCHRASSGYSPNLNDEKEVGLRRLET